MPQGDTLDFRESRIELPESVYGAGMSVMLIDPVTFEVLAVHAVDRQAVQATMVGRAGVAMIPKTVNGRCVTVVEWL